MIKTPSKLEMEGNFFNLTKNISEITLQLTYIMTRNEAFPLRSEAS